MAEKKNYWRYEIGIIVGAGIVLGSGMIRNYTEGVKQLNVPNTAKVEQGFVIPNKLEKITCEDLDGNGLCKTIFKYDGKRFLLKYDGNKITGEQYTIEPLKTTPQ